MSETIMDNVKALVADYATPLAEAGIACTVSKRYLKEPVFSRSHHRYSVLSLWLDERRERQYKNQPNRYHVAILRFVPVETSQKKGHYKEYAFLLRQMTRPHTGKAPVERIYREEQVLQKIEKRLQKMGKRPACKDTLWDGLRYAISLKYAYKKQILGKSRYVFELAIAVILISAMLAIGLLIG